MQKATVTRLRAPMLLELRSSRWIEAIGALKSAGFRVYATEHTNRFRIADAIPTLTTPVTTNKGKRR